MTDTKITLANAKSIEEYLASIPSSRQDLPTLDKKPYGDALFDECIEDTYPEENEGRGGRPFFDKLAEENENKDWKVDNDQ